MAGEQQVGNIVYEVEMNVAKLIESQQKVNARLDDMEGKFEKTGKAVSGTERSFSSLTRVASALTAALSVQQVANYADAWTTLNNKLANSIRTGESLVQVTQRVFDITQSTRSSLDATASLYARLERATREYGTSAENVAKLTTIINQGFVVSGATAQEAENAIIQLSQGLASGALRGEEFNSVNEQGNRLIVALADSMGVSIGQMRAMAAQGKLTTDVVVNGLLGQGDVIGKEFANTTQTIGQAFQTAGNNITQFVGSSTTVKAGVAIFNDAVVTLSENLDVVSTVILAVTAVMGSRYVAALVLATQKQLALAASSYSAATAQGALAAASSGLRGAMALVGGPAGVATLAATAIFFFYQKAQQAKQEANDLADGVGALVAKFKEMSATELGASIARMRESMGSLSDSVDDAQKAYDNATYRVSDLRKEIDNWGKGTTRGRQAADALSGAMDDQYIAADALERAQKRLSQTQSAITLGQAQLTTGLKTGIDLLSRESTAAGDAAGMMNHFAKSINLAAAAKEKFNASSLQIPRSEKADDYNKSLEDENALLAITDKRLRAVTKARMEATAKGGNQNQINTAAELAGAQYDLQRAEEQRNAAVKEGTSLSNKAATQAESVAQKLENLKEQSEMAADSTRELSREQAILAAQQSLGNAATQADIKLAGQYAAAKWDTGNAIRAQAAAEKLLPERRENASYQQDVSDLNTALSAKKISQEQYNATSEQLEQQHQINLAKIRSEQAVSPQLAAAGTVDPVQALANENAQKLALIQQFEQQKVITQQQSIALMNAANTQYEQARINAAWQIWENQNTANQLLGSAIDSLQGGATNAITGLLNGTQSLSEAFANIGSTILNSVVSGLVEMGLQYVKNMIMGQVAATAALASTTAQATAAAAAWAPAAISASIATMGAASATGTTAYSTALVASKGLAIAGARKDGGPVSAGSMYQVGEGGKPEIYQASTGKQYMIPGDNGKVISNKDMMGGSESGGGVVMNVAFHVQTTNGIDEATQKQMAQMMQTVAIRTIKDQQRPNGLLRK
ncbi:tape measure protein [Erwinia rhapontici]|uniref:tape measure protein n=1 Tax=Erwinia rhapontici TaxID=55212 RepID=UPI0014382777|nr:tape measure protein [Erwinia rhapontici]NKG32498.1 tape measure protein [Erwinia rhapontici]